MKGDSMCIGWAVMFFRRLKKPVCTAENHGLQTGYYQYNNFFGAAFAAGCIHCEKGNFNFPLTFFSMGSYHIAAPALRRLFSASEKVKLGLGQACDLALLLQLRGGSALIRTAQSKAPAHSRSPKRGKAQRPSMRRQCRRPARLHPRSAFGWRV